MYTHTQYYTIPSRDGILSNPPAISTKFRHWHFCSFLRTNWKANSR